MALGKKIAIIGSGNMGEALIAGMLAAKAAAPDEIHATDILPQRLDYLKARYQIRVGMDNKAAAAWSDITTLAVEPQVLDEVLDSLRGPHQRGAGRRRCEDGVAARCGPRPGRADCAGCGTDGPGDRGAPGNAEGQGCLSGRHDHRRPARAGRRPPASFADRGRRRRYEALPGIGIGVGTMNRVGARSTG